MQWVRPTDGDDHIILVTADGQAIQFVEKNVRAMGRVAAGVRGIKLHGTDEIVGMEVIASKAKKGAYQLFTLMKHGYGKRTPVEEYKVQGRGGSGIMTANVTDKTGSVVSARIVRSDDERDLLVVSEAGQVIRTALSSVSVLGRATQGVRVMRFKKEGDAVATAELV